MKHTRTLVDLSPTTIHQLDEIAKKQHVSRAKLIRSAISSFLAHYNKENQIEAFGILKSKPGLDSIKLQNQLRNEW